MFVGNVKVSFCCPIHGNLKGEVLYTSIILSSKKIVDLSYKYCDRCDINYTPFGSYLCLFPNINIRGKKLTVGMMSQEQRVLVRRPKTVSIENINNDKSKKFTARNVFIRELFLTNKLKFIKEHLCTKCFCKLKKEYVGVKMFDKGGYVCSNIYSCEICKQDYVGPEMLKNIYNKAYNK